MKKSKVLFSCLLALFIGYVSQSCQEVKTNEFIATNSTFVSYQTWTLEKTNVGPSPSLGAAHAGNDSTVTREIYFKDDQDPISGVYPVGTVIAKHSHNPSATVAEYVGMAKRGNNYNSSHNDWEWFMMTSAGTIALDGNGDPLRGANLMGGLCNSCHMNAQVDYCFTK